MSGSLLDGLLKFVVVFIVIAFIHGQRDNWILVWLFLLLLSVSQVYLDFGVVFVVNGDFLMFGASDGLIV